MWPKKEKAISCAECGECCEGVDVGIVLNKPEEELLRASGTILEHDELFEALYMDSEEDAKAFLFGSPCGYHCRDEHGSSTCSVYEQRPQACRDFEFKGEECVRLQNRRATRMKTRTE